LRAFPASALVDVHHASFGASAVSSAEVLAEAGFRCLQVADLRLVIAD